MTVTEWLSNIKKIVGEGYSNFEAEATIALKTSILDAIQFGADEHEIYGLVHSKTVSPTLDNNILVSELLTSGQEFIRINSVSVLVGTADTNVPMMSHHFHECALANPDYANGKPYCYFIKYGSDTSLEFVNIDTISYDHSVGTPNPTTIVYQAWEDAWITPLTPDTTNVLEYFSQTFIDMVTNKAAERLLGMVSR